MLESLKKLLKHFTVNQETASTTNSTANQKTDATPQPDAEEFGDRYITLGKFNLGLGTIGPDNRSDVDPKTVDELYQAIEIGSFNIPVSGAVPENCFDSGIGRKDTKTDAPHAAGGTLSIVYGSDLGGNSTSPDYNEIRITSMVINTLKAKGHSTSVHGDDHHVYGCGACAKAPTIYQHVTERIHEIASLMNRLGISISDREKEAIAQQAKNRLKQVGFFADDRVFAVKTAQDNGALYEELTGKHNALGIALNTKPGTTVDRFAIRARYGPQYDMFVIDIWSFGTAAKDVNWAGNNDDIQRITKAITIQNIAAASILGHSSLRIVPIV